MIAVAARVPDGLNRSFCNPTGFSAVKMQCRLHPVSGAWIRGSTACAGPGHTQRGVLRAQKNAAIDDRRPHLHRTGNPVLWQSVWRIRADQDYAVVSSGALSAGTA